MYFDIGIPGPAGFKALAATGVKLTPKYVGLLTKTGSPGGSTIILNVQGVGKNDTIYQVQYKDHDDAWKNLCASHSVIAYGRIECMTKAMNIGAGTQTRIMETSGGTGIECANTDVSQCVYSQIQTAMPEISAVSIKDAGSIEFTGTSFQIAGYTANATFGGVYADIITIDSDTLATATWNKGVPVVAVATAPVLFFSKKDAF